MKKITYFIFIILSFVCSAQEQLMLDIRLQIANNTYITGDYYLKIKDSYNQNLFDSNGLKVENYGAIFNLSQSSFPLTIIWKPGALNVTNNCLFDCIYTFSYSYNEYLTGQPFIGKVNSILEQEPFFTLYSPYVNQLTAETSTIGICSDVYLLSGFAHYYSIDNVNWNIVTNNIPFSFATFVPYDLLGQNFRGNLRIKSEIKTSYASPQLTIMSKIINYNVIGCSPNLEHDPPLVSNPSCTNTASGSIPLKFKSDIKDDEQLLLNLFINTTTPQFLDSKFVPKSSIINNEYTWEKIGAGNYIIKYQVQKTTDNTTHVNSSALTTKAFSIVDPPKLEFTVSANNPLCNNGATTLTIVASGGTPPYFYDDLEGDTEIINGETKIKRIQFNTSDEKTNIVSIPLSNPKNQYTIKVTDSNNCIEK